MSVIVTIRIPAADFILDDVLAARPTGRVRLERVVPIGDHVVPYLWLRGFEADHLDDLAAADSVIESEVLDTAGDDRLVRVSWASGINGLLDAFVETDVAVLDAVGSGGEWTLTLRFSDHATLSAFHDWCLDNDVRVTVERIRNPAYPHDDTRYGLTETQRTTLLRASELGYFEVPRAVTLADLADALGVSDTAASQRLRRGVGRLIDHTLLDSPDEP